MRTETKKGKKRCRFFSVCVIAVLVVSIFAGCGNSGGASQTPPASAPESPAPADTTPVNDGKVYEFKIDYPNSENTAIFPVLDAWTKYVDEKSGGRIKATIYPNGQLGALPDCVNNCLSGMTDGFWSGVTIYSGVFPSIEALGLPMLGANNNQVMTAAMNEMLMENADVSKEFSKLKVVALHSGAASPVLFNMGKDITGVDAFKGANLRISNAYTTDWFQQMGANPVTCGFNDGYEYMEKGIINGGLFFYDQVQGFALYEQMDHMLVATNTIYPLTMFCLNKDRYDELPDDLKAIIDESTEWFLDQLPEIFSAQKAKWIGVSEENGVVIDYADDKFLADLTTKAEPSWDLWVKTLTDSGHDGQATLDQAKSIIKKFNEQFPNPD